MSNCKKCGVEQTEQNTYRYSDTTPRANMRGRLAGWCRGCLCKSVKGAYAKNPAKIMSRSAIRRARFCVLVNGLKAERPCYDCGGKFPPEAMDWDHLGGKKYTIGHMKTSNLDKVREEIDKCQLVCSNCHRIRTKLRKNGVCL